MATFAEMKTMVAAYMQRDATTFTVNAVDLLGKAVNQARKWAEMERSFELNRVQTQLAISLQNGTDISGMVLASDGTTPVTVKSIIKGFLALPDAATAVFPIDVITRDKHLERVERHYDRVNNLTDLPKGTPNFVGYMAVVRLGNLLYLAPNDSTLYNNATSVTVKFDSYKFLADYSADGDTDFFLTTCENFMLLRSCYQLNFFLKDDQRVPISAAVMESAWNAVVRWDANLVEADCADANLD